MSSKIFKFLDVKIHYNDHDYFSIWARLMANPRAGLLGL
jgi:hypothetical protein